MNAPHTSNDFTPKPRIPADEIRAGMSKAQLEYTDARVALAQDERDTERVLKAQALRDREDALQALVESERRCVAFRTKGENYLTRINELVAENAKLRRELKAAAKPAPQEAPKARVPLAEKSRIVSLLASLRQLGFVDDKDDEAVLLQLNAFAMALDWANQDENTYENKDVAKLLTAISNARQKLRNAELDKDIPEGLKPKTTERNPGSNLVEFFAQLLGGGAAKAAIEAQATKNDDCPCPGCQLRRRLEADLKAQRGNAC